VEVRLRAKTEPEAVALSRAISLAVEEKITLINSISGQGISFAAIAGDPIIVKNSLAIWLNILDGFLVGLAVAIFAKAGRSYLK